MNEKLMFRILNSKDSMYDLCENMEQVYDNFYEPLFIEYQELQKTLMNNLNTIRELEKKQNIVLQQENKQLKEMIDGQDGCNKRRLQIFELKDKLCKELKNVKNLKQENEQLKSIIKTLMKEFNLEPSEYVEKLLKGDSNE